jgi:hypothetical protein
MQQIKTSPRARQARIIPLSVLIIGWLTTEQGFQCVWWLVALGTLLMAVSLFWR